MLAYVPATDSFELLELSGEGMTVYLHDVTPKYEIRIQPANDQKILSTLPDDRKHEFFTVDGNPRMFIIPFTCGQSVKVSNNVGNYLLASGLAKPSPIQIVEAA